MKACSLATMVDGIVNDEILKVLDELTAILDMTDDYRYRELYQQARTYIFEKRMEIKNDSGGAER